jgi:hypothetical protein
MAEFSLDVVRGGEVVKTLKASDYSIPWGAYQDILSLAGLAGRDKSALTGDPELMGKAVSAMAAIGPLLADMFPDATEEDIRAARMPDVMRLLGELMRHVKAEVGEPKNA